MGISNITLPMETGLVSLRSELCSTIYTFGSDYFSHKSMPLPSLIKITLNPQVTLIKVSKSYSFMNARGKNTIGFLSVVVYFLSLGTFLKVKPGIAKCCFYEQTVKIYRNDFDHKFCSLGRDRPELSTKMKNSVPYHATPRKSH